MSAQENQLLQGTRPRELPQASRAGGPAATSQAWMVTFTDLVALMLTFFVLMFSMSRIDQVQWQNLADSLSRSLDQVAEPREPKPAKQLDIHRIAHRPGNNLDYLTAVLGNHLSEQEALAGAFLARRGGQVVIALPAHLVFETLDEGEVVHGQGRRLLFVLGGLLGKMGNRVEVAGHIKGPQSGHSKRSTWQASLRRGELVSQYLAATGFNQAILVRGQGHFHADHITGVTNQQREHLADRVDIIIYGDSGEVP